MFVCLLVFPNVFKLGLSFKETETELKSEN